jgi:hypothetical protein
MALDISEMERKVLVRRALDKKLALTKKVGEFYFYAPRLTVLQRQRIVYS